MTTRPRRRENLTLEMGECLGKRVIPLVRVRRRRGVHMNIMTLQKRLKHLPRSEQEIGIATLAPELE